MQRVQKRVQTERNHASVSVGFSKFNWLFTRPISQEQANPVLLLRAWHRAFLSGFSLRRLSVNGKEVSSRELERLNLWIQAHGAWRCSSLPHWEALEAIEHALFGHPLKIRPGKAGGGRVAHLVESHDQPEKISSAKAVRPANTVPPRKRDRRRKSLEGKAAAEEMAAFDRALGLP